MKTKPRILIFCDWFEPGFRAGGPIRSISNIISSLSDKLELFIITSDRDLGDKNGYEGITVNRWIKTSQYFIYYASPDNLTVKKIRELIKNIDPVWIYLNSMYSMKFSLFPQLACYFYSDQKPRILLAPRGMLKSSALKFKRSKKKIFLFFYKLLKLDRKAIFQATSIEEVEDIKTAISVHSRIILLPNLSNLNDEFQPVAHKEKGHLRLIFIGRIHPIKNLYYTLDLLSKSNGGFYLTIVGEIDDNNYWEKCRKFVSQVKNITITVLHEVPHKKIVNLIHQHHVLILPTKGENHGHAIFESLCAGRPVITSDQTPWRNLSRAKAGWDIPLTDADFFIERIEELVDMETDEINIWTKGAWDYSKNYNDHNNTRAINGYLDFFRNGQ